MEIYREADQTQYRKFLSESAAEAGSRRNILPAPPVYTISPELLAKTLQENGVESKAQKAILRWAAEQRRFMEQVLTENAVLDENPDVTEDAFRAQPIVLPLAGIFYQDQVTYSYEAYRAHLEQTRQFARTHPDYTVRFGRQAFRNLQIQTLRDRWAVVSKGKTPMIHFIIRHPKLVSALCDFTPPVVEETVGEDGL